MGVPAPSVRARRSPAAVVALGLVPVLLAVAMSLPLRGAPPAGLHRLRDLHVFWAAGAAYLRGGHVYPPLGVVAHPPAQLAGNLFVYPAPVAALFAPLSLLPYSVVCVLFAFVSLTAIAGALRLLGVRDWRCYGAVALWPMTMTSVTIGTLSPLLLLAVAALWRFRDRGFAAAMFAGLAIVAKLFLWPLLIWLAASRRPRAAAWAFACGLTVSLLAWIPLGGLGAYPRLLHALSLAEGGSSFQPLWLLPLRPEVLLTVMEAAALAGGLLLALVSRRLPDAGAFALAIGVALLFCPIVWPHYFVLLVVPLALRSPRFSALWLAPIVMWVYPFPQRHGAWPALLFAAVAAGMTAAAVMRSAATRVPAAV